MRTSQLVVIATGGCLALGSLAGCASRAKAAGVPENIATVTAENLHGPYVPAGRQLLVALDRDIGTGDKPGTPFTGRLRTALEDESGNVIVAPGATLRGHVVSAEGGDAPSLALNFDTVETTKGRARIRATLVSAENSGWVPKPVYDPLVLGYDAAVYPYVGAIGGGPAEPGTIVKPREVRLPKGAELRLELTRPLVPPGTVVVPPS